MRAARDLTVIHFHAGFVDPTPCGLDVPPLSNPDWDRVTCPECLRLRPPGERSEEAVEEWLSR
jgi:hypothetical protein